MREVVRASSLSGLRDLVREMGGDVDALAAEVGLDMSAAARPEHFVSARKVYELTNLAAVRLNRLDFGLRWGQRSDPRALGPLFPAVSTARTGLEAINLMARFVHTHAPLATLQMRLLPDGQHYLVGIRNWMRKPPPLIQFFERRTVSSNVLLRLICGGDYHAAEVWFTHDRQSAPEVYEEIFDVRPRFGMEETGIVLDRNLLDSFRPGANARLCAAAEAFLKSQGPPANDSMAAEVLGMMRILLRTSNCTPADTSRALGVPERTLQRRLYSEGTSFETIKDSVRRMMAEAMLADPAAPFSEIAYALHYSSQSAFSRSCRRWFGMSPGMMRQKLLLDARPDRKRIRELAPVYPSPTS